MLGTFFQAFCLAIQEWSGDIKSPQVSDTCVYAATQVCNQPHDGGSYLSLLQNDSRNFWNPLAQKQWIRLLTRLLHTFPSGKPSRLLLWSVEELVEKKISAMRQECPRTDWPPESYLPNFAFQRFLLHLTARYQTLPVSKGPRGASTHQFNSLRSF